MSGFRAQAVGESAGSAPPSRGGVPGLSGIEHIGITVPDIEAATRFFVEVIGGRVLFDAGPFCSTDDWLAEHLDVHPRAVIDKLRMIKLDCGPALELFAYTAPDQEHRRPRNSDYGGHHLAFYVDDMAAAVTYLHECGVQTLGEPTTMTEGASAGLTWLYFLAPWGLQLELVSAPTGLAYANAGGEAMWRPKSGTT